MKKNVEIIDNLLTNNEISYLYLMLSKSKFLKHPKDAQWLSITFPYPISLYLAKAGLLKGKTKTN